MIEQRRLIDRINANILQQSWNSRSGRQSRRFTEHPYFLRNNSDISPSNGRVLGRHVHFSSTNREYNYHVNINFSIFKFYYTNW